jgi:hypothetical protein
MAERASIIPRERTSPPEQAQKRVTGGGDGGLHGYE